VRDLLLGREPADYDVATSATPDEVMRIFPQTYAVGAQFGVVLVAAQGARASVETETGRREAAKVTSRSPPSAPTEPTLDGRHPDSVRYTTSPQQDVERRDFTINGLLLDPL
jgi:poly(A) polymerase